MEWGSWPAARPLPACDPARDDALTAPKTRQFVGSISAIPFSSVIVETLDGGTQNEGIDMIFADETDPPSSVDFGNDEYLSVFVMCGAQGTSMQAPMLKAPGIRR